MWAHLAACCLRLRGSPRYCSPFLAGTTLPFGDPSNQNRTNWMTVICVIGWLALIYQHFEYLSYGIAMELLNSFVIGFCAEAVCMCEEPTQLHIAPSTLVSAIRLRPLYKWINKVVSFCDQILTVKLHGWIGTVSGEGGARDCDVFFIRCKP